MEPTTVSLLAILFGFFGIVVGAILQHIFVARREEKKEILDRKKQSYTYLVEAISNLAYAQISNDTEGAMEFSARLERSKMEIVLFASEGVLKELSTWFSEHKTNTTPEARECFAKMLSEMRKDCGLESSNNMNSLVRSLLFSVNSSPE